MSTYTQNRYDLHPLPDKRTTGCHGPLVHYTEFFGKDPLPKNGLLYIDKNTNPVIENVLFDNGVEIYSNTALVKADKVILKNCMFIGDRTASTAPIRIMPDQDWDIINCSFIGTAGAVANITGKGKYNFYNCYADRGSGDGFKAEDNIYLHNCYCASAGLGLTAHADGFQLSNTKGTKVETWRCDNVEIPHAKVRSNASTFICLEIKSGLIQTEYLDLSDFYENGGGYTTQIGGKMEGEVIQGLDFQRSIVGCSYQFGTDRIPDYVPSSSVIDRKQADTCLVSSIWKDNGFIHLLVTNYVNSNRTLLVRTNKGLSTFTVPKCPTYNEIKTETVTPDSKPEHYKYMFYSDMPYNIEYIIPDAGAEYVVCFDGTEDDTHQIRYVEFEVPPTPTRNKIDSIELPTGTYELKDANSFYAEDITTVINEDSTDEEIPSALAVYNLGSTSDYELKSNKLTSLTSTATDDNYMSAKWLYDLLGWLQESPERPIVPKTGTWQLKPEYQNKKYICIGTDDDNQGNTKVYRMLRTYNFPYKMNTASSSVLNEKNLGSDVDDCFTSEDAPSLFPNYTTTVNEVAEYIHNNPQTGEVAMHGGEPLWDSSKLSGTYWNELYSQYISDGGTKSEADLKTEIMAKGASRDIAQGASIVSDYRQTLEDTLGFYISSVGIWGGGYVFTLDEGMTVNLNRFYNNNYPWRDNDYMYAGTILNSGTGGSHNPWKGNRRSIVVDIESKIDAISNGDLVDFYTHWWGDFTPEEWRTILDTIKSYVDSGQLEVVTGEQYYKMGEFV